MADSGGALEQLRQDNLNELAVRLGSKSKFRSTGKIWFATDFANGIETQIPSGTNVSWSADRSLGSGFSAKVDITAIAGAGSTGNIAHHEPPYVVFPDFNGRCGFEFSFAQTHAFSFTLYLIWWYNFNSRQHLAQLRIRQTEIMLYTANGGLQSIGSQINFMGNTTTRDIFHIVKLLVDWKKLQYLELLIDQHKIPLTGIGLWESATSDTAGFVNCQLEADYRNSLGQVYFGHEILTVDEPE